MTLAEAVKHARRRLKEAGVEDSGIEAELLLMQTLDIGRAALYSHPESEISAEQQGILNSLLQRRLAGEPSAYISGSKEFYGLDFIVDGRALIPRPETELLVDEALRLADKYEAPVIADVGTGSGVIAVCLALNLPQARVYATDVSTEALEVAAVNCQKHGVADRVRLLQGDLLEPLTEALDIVVSNPPYVPTTDCDKLRGEPKLALDGGPDGLDIIRRLVRQARSKLKSGAKLLLEIGIGQDREVVSLLEGHFPASKIEVENDLAGIPRVVILHAN